MNELIEFWNKKLISLGDFNLTVKQTIILAVGLVVILVAHVVVTRIFKRNKTLQSLSPKLSRLILRMIVYFIWIVGIVLLLRLENVNTNNFFSYIIFKGDKISITVMKIFIIAVIIFLIRLVLLVVEYMISRKVAKQELEVGKGHSILQITRYLIWIVGILIAISSLGLKLTFIIASVSALLVGIGFGLQNIFNDFFSGIILLFDRSIQVRDVIQVGEIVGEVEEIGIRTTKIIDRDNIVLIIPNSKFTQDNVINWSHHDQKSRFNVSVGVEYGSDVQLVEKILLECAKETADIEKTPPPFVRFEDFGNSSLDFNLFFWTYKSFRVENIKSRLRFLIDEKFRGNNIVIPFPQNDLHIKSDFRVEKK
jgi:small-conductance mechanosensitive channel